MTSHNVRPDESLPTLGFHEDIMTAAPSRSRSVNRGTTHGVTLSLVHSSWSEPSTLRDVIRRHKDGGPVPDA